MVSGDGTGQFLTILLDQLSLVTEVGLIAGYDKVDSCTAADRFFELRRISEVLWIFDNGFTQRQVLNTSTRSPQLISLGEGVISSSITLQVLSTTLPGNPLLDHTPISEIFIR
jgi:hypothetical protein